MKLPAIQFYTGDWRKDPGVQSLSYHDRGVWLEMLCLMSESSERGKLLLNGKPMPTESLARILGLDNQILTTTLTTLLTSGVASQDEETGVIYNRRMVRDENVRKVRTEAGKKGGNPLLLNQIPTTMDNQIPTPSSSSSVSTSSTKNKYPTLDEVKLACAKSAIPDSDAEWFFHKCEGNGWTNDGKPIKKWLSTIIAWKNANYLPSQKAKQNASNPRRPHSAAYSGSVEDNPRNAGTCKPVTDYAAEAAKRQQQQRDRIENEAMARQVAANEPEPPAVTGNG